MTVNWRSLGDIDVGIWTRTLYEAGSPLKSVAPEAYKAASPMTALCLAMMKEESRYGTDFRRNVSGNHNPLNLRPPSGNGYLAFDGWVDGIRAWTERLTDPTYKGGVYARTESIPQLVHVYAPASDSNDEDEYVAGIENSLLRWGITPQEVTPSMATLTFGRVPYPAVIQSHLPASNPYVKESGAPDIPEAVFWHRMIGTFNGTNNWFHQGKGATAYGVAVAATDGPSLAGKIYEWIKPGTGWYGESSGPAEEPYGDGAKLIAKVGVVSVNRTTKAIEISGNYDTPLDDKARSSVCAMTAYWADQKHIPWNDFPNVPGENRSFVIWHNEITGTDYKECPGDEVMDETPALIERTKQIMKQYQENAVPDPEYAKPLPIPFKAGDYGWRKLGDVSVFCLEAEVEVVRATTPLAWADGDKSDGEKAPNAGPKLKQGERVKVIGSFYNENAKGQTVRWLIRASDNARIIGSSCRPLLPVKQ